MNHFSDEMSIGANLVRPGLRSEGRLIYAMFDFNVSIMLPPTARKEDFRLPYYESWVGSYSFPCDTEQGEFDYNPFVFDVGVLAVELRHFFQVRHLNTVVKFFFWLWHSIMAYQFLCWYHFLTGCWLTIWNIDSLLMKHWNFFKMNILN